MATSYTPGLKVLKKTLFKTKRILPLKGNVHVKIGQNITPDKLKKSSAEDIFKICNKYLSDIINMLNAKKIIGVGKYANKMAHIAIKENNLEGIIIEEIPHPSPANPLANKDKGALWKKISKSVIMGK